MISPLSKSSPDDLTAFIKALNEEYHLHGFMPVRFSFSEFKEVAEYLVYNTDTWSPSYNDEVLSRFNYLELTFIKRISKCIDSPGELDSIKYELKISNNQTRRVCYEVLENKKKNNSIRNKIKGVFTNA